MADTPELTEIAHQLTRIADQLNQTGEIEIRKADALKAWPLRIYEDEWLQGLTNLGIRLI